MFLRTVADPRGFRIAEVAFGRIVSIEDNPRLPKSDLALTGLGMFENSVSSKIRLVRERRWQDVEHTDAAGIYLNESRLVYALREETFALSGSEANLDSIRPDSQTALLPEWYLKQQ